MYVPSHDTFLLADCIREHSGRWALEIGVGSGFLLNILQKNFDYVVGSDIDLGALKHSKYRLPRVLLVCCDAASAFSPYKFDLIVSNPPYLPDDSNNNNNNNRRDMAVHGGRKGIETTIHFVNSALSLLAREGKMLLVISSLADSSALDEIIERKNVHKRVVKEKRLFYETLSIIQLSI